MANKTKKPMSKGGKIAIISISAALVIGGGVTAIVFSTQIKEFIDKWFYGAKIEKVDNEYQTEKGVVVYDDKGEKIEKELPYKYLGSAEQTINLKEEGSETLTPTVTSAHTFLIGRVNSVPFYQSGWTKFDYENIGMTISFSNITTESVSNSLSTTNERVESSSWSTSLHLENTFKTSAEAGVGPIKAKAENTINFQLDKTSSGSSMQRYVSSNEQTKTSIETLQKTSDYSIQLNSRNGFKKGKYYRMTLQQSASMYMIIYEKAGKPADDPEKLKEDAAPNAKYYELTSYLADPSNYTMVIEEADNPTIEPKESTQFDSNLYDRCAQWIDDVRAGTATDPEKFDYVYEDDNPDPVKSRKELLDGYFKDKDKVSSDLYFRDPEYRITDRGKSKNPSDKVTFPTLFKSKGSPTFAELFNPKEDAGEYAGYGFTTVDVELQFEYRRYDHAYSHIYLVDKNQNDIQHIKENDISKSWTQKRVVWTGIDAADKLRTTLDFSRADGWIQVMYDGSGASSDDWGIRNLIMQVTIY